MSSVHISPSHSQSHHITSNHIISHHIISNQITSHQITLHNITSCHITTNHITSHHIISQHIKSYHITSHRPSYSILPLTFQCIHCYQIISHHIISLAGILLSICLVSAVLGNLFFGCMADALGRKRMFEVALGFMIFGSFFSVRHLIFLNLFIFLFPFILFAFFNDAKSPFLKWFNVSAFSESKQRHCSFTC